MKIIDGYDKKTEIEVRPMTLDEVKALTHGHVDFIDLQGKLRHAKVNGKCRTWKRDPSRFELPLKYGMYEYWTITPRELDRLVVRV